MSNHENRGIRIVAVLGTARPGNFTAKALALVIDEIKKHEDISLQTVDPSAMNLPLAPDTAG